MTWKPPKPKARDGDGVASRLAAELVDVGEGEAAVGTRGAQTTFAEWQTRGLRADAGHDFIQGQTHRRLG